MNEAIALAEVRAGNAAAYQFLVERYQTPITRYLERLLGDRAIAEDAAQHAFIEAFYAISKNRNGRYRQLAEKSIPLFFYTFATQRALQQAKPNLINQLLPFVRKSGVDHKNEKLPDEHQLYAPPPNVPRVRIGEPVQSNAERAEQERLQAQLLRLPREQAACLLLHSMVGLTYEEVATVLNRSIAQVRTQIGRGRQALLSEAG